MSEFFSADFNPVKNGDLWVEHEGEQTRLLKRIVQYYHLLYFDLHAYNYRRQWAGALLGDPAY